MAGYTAEVTADTPDVWLRFEEQAGNFLDSSGHGVTTSIFGSAPTRGVAGMSGYGITATSANIILAYNALSKLAESVEWWVKTTSTGKMVLEQGRGGGGDNGTCLSMAIGPTGFGSSAGQVSAFINATSLWRGRHTSATIHDGNFHHVVATWAQSAGTFDPSNILIYIDGALASSSNDSGNTGSTSAPISGQNGMRLLDDVTGTITVDEFAFYSSQLSAARVLAHYNARPHTRSRLIIV